MGLRVKRQFGGLTLEKYAERSTRQLRRVHQQAADRIAEVAAEMAPRLTGDLEDSIEVMNARGQGGRTIFSVSYSAPYGIYMHEGVYNLGPLSAEKDAMGEFRVGRKFLERASDQVLYNEGYLKDAYRAAVRYK